MGYDPVHESEKEMLEGMYRESRGHLDKVLKELTPAQLAQAEARARELFRDADPKDKTNLRRIAGLVEATRQLSSYRAVTDKEKVLERLARTSDVVIGRAKSSVSMTDESPKESGKFGVSDALTHFIEAVDNLARARFPEELRQQEEAVDQEREQDPEFIESKKFISGLKQE